MDDFKRNRLHIQLINAIELKAFIGYWFYAEKNFHSLKVEISHWTSFAKFSCSFVS